MRKLWILCTLCILLFTACSKDTKQEDILVNANFGMNPLYEEGTAYQLELSFDPEQHTISGSETVILTNTSETDWDRVYFRDYPSDNKFQRMTDGGITKISNVVIQNSDGKLTKAEDNFWRDEKDNSIIYFTLAKALKPKETIAISFNLVVHIPENYDRFGYADIGYNLGYFFPILSVFESGEWVNHPTIAAGECAYSKSATFDVKVAAPEGYTVITTGEMILKEDNLFSFHAEKVRDFTMVIGNQFEVISGMSNGVSINSYYISGHKEGGEKVLQAAASAIEAYSAAIGPYPYASMDCVGTSLPRQFAGMEYPQLIMLSDELYSMDNSLLSLVTAHETAHQWFYGIIGNDQYMEAWIDEGFATYLENVYYEYTDKAYGEQRLNQTAVAVEVYSNNGNKLGGQPLNQSYKEYGEAQIYARTVYTRAGEFLVTLRKAMGIEAFNAALKELYDTYRYKETSTEAVLDIFKKHTEEDLTALYSYYIK